MTGRCPVDQGVDLDPIPDDRGHQFAGQFGRRGITFRVGEMPLEDRLGRALPEVGLEDRGERESTPGRTTSVAVGRAATTASGPWSPVSLRRHRR
ncbi:MAG TPA: hypothetical protein VF253_12765 [Candidatus Limnocylindrales bacterium]